MGFFGKLKQNINHGGVSVKLQAPASISMADATVPLSVTVQSKDAPATINRVAVTLTKESIDRTSAQPGSNQSTNSTLNEDVSRTESTEVFNLAAGESKTLNLSLAMNLGKAAESLLGSDSALGKVAHGLGMLEQVADQAAQTTYNYSFHAIADVEGITLDPGDMQPVQVLKPGQFGGAANIKL